MPDPRVLRAREAERKAHAVYSRADTAVQVLEDRQERAEAQLGSFLRQWRGLSRNDVRFLDEVEALRETGLHVSGEKVIPCDSPPDEKVVRAANEALRDAEKAWKQAREALADAVRQAVEDPHVPEPSRYSCARDRLVLAGEVYYRGEPVDGAAVRGLGPRKVRQLVENGFVDEDVEVPA